MVEGPEWGYIQNHCFIAQAWAQPLENGTPALLDLGPIVTAELLHCVFKVWEGRVSDALRTSGTSGI